MVVDRNEEIISDISRIALKLGRGLDDKRGQDGDEKRNLCTNR